MPAMPATVQDNPNKYLARQLEGIMRVPMYLNEPDPSKSVGRPCDGRVLGAHRRLSSHTHSGCVAP